MEELNRYYEVWRETNYIYEDWAKQHGTSACCLLTLISIDESEDPCTQKRISQQWSMPKQTIPILRHANFLLSPVPP